MPIERSVLEEHVARLNGARRKDQQVEVAAYAPRRFTLSFPNRAMPEGQCIDQDFSEIQFTLHDDAKVDTGIVAGRLDPETDRYFIEYETIEWDEP